MLTLPRKPYEDNRQPTREDITHADPVLGSLATPDAFQTFMERAKQNIKVANLDVQTGNLKNGDFNSIDFQSRDMALSEQSSEGLVQEDSGSKKRANDDLVRGDSGSINQVGDLFEEHYLSTLTLLVQQLMEAVLIVDAAGVIQMVSSKAVDLLMTERAGDPDEILGRCWQDFLREPQKTRYQKMLEEQLQSLCQIKHTPIEASLTLDQGDSLDVEFSISFLGLNSPLFAIVIRDLTKQKAEYQQLYQWASTDCLTKLANRRVFDASLRAQWQECTTTSKPISVVIIDIDYFKQFNDKYGHVQGDHCLQKIANVIANSMPSDECVAARYGGEEFALILPGFDAQQAELMAEYIQIEINGLSYTDLGLDESVSVSVSQGIAAEVNGQFRTGTALLCAADTALYRAKTDGRNRINISC